MCATYFEQSSRVDPIEFNPGNEQTRLLCDPGKTEIGPIRPVPNPDSEVESEFEERNIELEEWLGEWMEKELGEAARELFSNEA